MALLPAVWVVASICNTAQCASDNMTISVSPERYAFQSSCVAAIADAESRRFWRNPDFRDECIKVWVWELPKPQR